MNFVSDIIKDKAAKVHGANAPADGEEMEQLLEFSRILETLRDSHLSGARPNLSLSIDQVLPRHHTHRTRARARTQQQHARTKH
jgi:hypothetical protein